MIAARLDKSEVNTCLGQEMGSNRFHITRFNRGAM